MLTASVSRSNVLAMYVRISNQEIAAIGSRVACFVGCPLHPSQPGRIKSDAIGGHGAGSKARLHEFFQPSPRGKESPREEVQVRKLIWIHPGRRNLVPRISGAAAAQKTSQQWRKSAAERSGHELSKSLQLPQSRHIQKSRIAGEQLVAAQPRQRHLQSHLPRRPGNKVRIDSIHGRLIERSDGFVQPRENRLPIQRNFPVL